MANPIWTSPGRDLGIIPENYYYELPLEAYDPEGGIVTFSAIAGQLPLGMYVTKSGSLQGVPLVEVKINTNRSYTFSIRAKDSKGLVSDTTFSITISNIVPPQIIPKLTSLGDVFDGSYYSLQLEATEVNSNATLTWSLTSGALPPGVTLTSTGLISGFILPLAEAGNAGLTGYGTAPYNEFGFENSPAYQNNAYTFTIQVFDGANYNSLTYHLTVISRSHWEADTTLDTVDSTLTVDEGSAYFPIMLTPSQSLITVRSNSKFAFQFQALDPNGIPFRFGISANSGGAAGFDQNGDNVTHTAGIGFDSIPFDQTNLALPPGLTLDPSTGWLYGTVGAQPQATETYIFEVYVYETAAPFNQSIPVQYTMTVLGDITNTITWTTNANLGSINNGSISQLSVTAVNNAGKAISYSLVTDKSHLPQGLKLLPSGLIVGRCSFEYFSLDGKTTTIDGGKGTFDNTYSFDVLATTVDGTASSKQTFTILVNNFNTIPYENIYLKALPSQDQRNLFLSIVNNTEIFPENLIYRSGDPNFGRAQDIRSLFLAGLNPSSIATYLSAITTNTYNKRIVFSNIKTAQALDSNFNVKYEVVYIELVDTENYNGATPANIDYDPILGINVYPNSFNNMQSVLVNKIGYANQSTLPDWMTSPQPNKRQLGFVNALVLAYTVPGASSLIAYRLKSNGIVFNNINFVADRYDLDNYLSTNFNNALYTFTSGQETTFDRLQRPIKPVVSVNYGIRGLSFDEINNQTVGYLQAIGGFDGATAFSDGDTLIFLQQEEYNNVVSANDGWNNVTQSGSTAIPGYLTNLNDPGLPPSTAGFPSNPYINQLAVVNGTTYIFSNTYNSNSNITGQVWKIANLRAGVWRINITGGTPTAASTFGNQLVGFDDRAFDDSVDYSPAPGFPTQIVTLTPVTFPRRIALDKDDYVIIDSSTIVPEDYVQINYGSNQNNSIVYYNPVLKPGQTVPAFTNVVSTLNTSSKFTKFDNYGTKFINNRDKYSNPEASDTWLNFPKTNVLQ